MSITEARRRLAHECICQGALDADVDRDLAGRRIAESLGLSPSQLAIASSEQLRQWGCAFSTAVSFRRPS